MLERVVVKMNNSLNMPPTRMYTISSIGNSYLVVKAINLIGLCLNCLSGHDVLCDKVKMLITNLTAGAF